MNKWFKQIRERVNLILPILWGTLWIVIISVGSLALAIWTIKLLFNVLGLM